MLIDGKLAESSDGRYIDIENPATRAVIASVPRGSDADVDRAVRAAAAAFEAWKRVTPKDRGRMLLRIADLVQPIINGQADMVIADRQTSKIEHFSFGKKLMQRVGTRVLNMAAGTKIPDAPSGFRAYSRDAAMQLNIVTRFSYAMETIIQAGHKTC